MRVLLVAPSYKELTTQSSEIQGVISALGPTSVTVVKGEVNEDSIVAALDQTNEPFDGIWFSSHGTEEGILLSSGVLLDKVALSQYISASGARWVFFNTCNSEGLVRHIHKTTNADVISVNVDAAGIPDTSAWRTARLLARELRITGDMARSIEKSAPDGAGFYHYWPNTRSRPPVSGVSGGPVSTGPVSTGNLHSNPDEPVKYGRRSADADVQESLFRLNTLIYGDDSLGLAGMKAQVEKNTGGLARIELLLLNGENTPLAINARVDAIYGELTEEVKRGDRLMARSEASEGKYSISFYTSLVTMVSTLVILSLLFYLLTSLSYTLP